ncbi:MAG: helix-turn-helix transcriptional regulator [Bacteroidota bacterium]
MNRDLIFFMSALGAFNAILLGLYFLFFRRPQQKEYTFLAALILALSIRTGKSVFFYFYDNLAQIFLHIGLGACALIGPFLYLYLSATLKPNGKGYRYWYYHLGFILIPFVFLCYQYPYYSHLEYWWNYFIPVLYVQWFVYIAFSARLILQYLPPLKQKNAQKSPQNTGRKWWVYSIFFGTLSVWLAYVFCGFGSYILGAVLFSFMLYLVLLLLLFRQKDIALDVGSEPKYADKKIDDQTAKSVLEQLDQIMQEKKLYRNPNLKLSDVAEAIAIHPHRLSQILNDNLGKSFPSFINQYRIEAAKELLQTNEVFSTEGIGFECGFNSKSTFYSTFKKLTGTTPAKFRAENSPSL